MNDIKSKDSCRISIKQFGTNIRKRREERNLTQTQLAEALGISPNQLSSIETGKSKTSFDVIAGLCDVLDVTPDYLMLGCLHSNNISKDLVDLIRSLPKEKVDFLYKVALLLRDTNL